MFDVLFYANWEFNESNDQLNNSSILDEVNMDNG